VHRVRRRQADRPSDELDHGDRRGRRRDVAALDAWRRRGLDGTVSIGPNQAPATIAAGILSIEFLVHAWDYAIATGKQITVPDPVADYVLGLASRIITPQGRTSVGFADPVDVAADADVFDQLIAFTGRVPVG
jgi:uncharacterized protein (TIGR03086 family)